MVLRAAHTISNAFMPKTTSTISTTNISCPQCQNPHSTSYYAEKKPTKVYASLTESIDQLYERLKVGGYVTPIPAKNPDAQSKWYDPNKICEYHSGMKWHTTEECCALRNKIHQLIEAKVIHWIDLVPKGFQP
ncbi:hypothetical protein KY284_020012 [Solanum tuberosum]|nr:hypothetical protein KY284_020012 [Solanum tuberosum]